MKIKAMGVLTDSLRTYNLQKGDLDELYGIFRSVNDYDIPIVRYIIYPSSGLIRQRINPHGKEFYSISELNYPPAICLPKYGRVNLPYQSMFYACSFTDTNSVDVPFPRIVSLLETSSFFKDKDSVGIERATVSRWEVTKPLNLIALPFVDEYRGKQIPAGKKSVTIRLTIGSSEKTLTSQEIESAANQVMKKLGKKLGAELRTQ